MVSAIVWAEHKGAQPIVLITAIMAEWDSFFQLLGIVCGVLTLMFLGALCNSRTSKKRIDDYLMRVEWVRKKWGTQMPFTFPKTGPDPRGPVPRIPLPPRRVGI